MLAREGEGGADAIGFGIEIEQGRELRLAALPPVIDDELARRRTCEREAEILLDQGEGEIDAGADPRRGPDRAVSRVDAIADHLDAGIASLQRGGVAPMGGGDAPVEQTRGGEDEGAGADAGDTARARRAGGGDGRELGRLAHAAADHEEGIEAALAAIVVDCLGRHRQSRRAHDAAAVARHDMQPIGLAGRQASGDLKRDQRPAQVEELEIGIDEEADIAGHGVNRVKRVVPAITVPIQRPGVKGRFHHGDTQDTEVSD